MSFSKIVRIILPLALILGGIVFATRSASPAAETTQRQVAVRQALTVSGNSLNNQTEVATEKYDPITPVTVRMTNIPPMTTSNGNSQYDKWLRGEVDFLSEYRVSTADAAALKAEALRQPVNPLVQIATTGTGPTLLSSFPSVDYSDGSNAVPPDPEMTAGSNHLIAVTNFAIEIYDKTGASVYGPINSDDFFSENSLCFGTFDPNAVYDEEADRYIIGIDANGLRYCAAVSATGDPLGDWYIYAVTANQMGAFHDYPHTGVGNDAIYVGANQFGGSVPQGYEGRVWALNKAAMYSGSSMTPVTFSLGYDGGTPQPLHLHGYLQGTWPSSNTHYIATDLYNGQGIQIWEWENALSGGAPTIVATINLTAGGMPIDVPQQGGQNIQANDWRLRQFEYHDGSGWVADSVSCNPGGGTTNCVRWAEIDLEAATPALVQQGLYGSSGQHRIFPDLAVNTCGDMVIGYTKSSTSMYPGIWFTGRQSADPAGTLQPEAELKAGEVPYTAYDPAPRRWGDYTGMTIDPNGTTFWYLGEYSKNIPGAARWGTYIGSFEYPECQTGGDDPLYELTYLYFLNDDSSGAGILDLYEDGSFTDSEGGGGTWMLNPGSSLLILQHDPGYSCTAFSIGFLQGSQRVAGVRICLDFTARKGIWLGSYTVNGNFQPQGPIGNPNIQIPEGFSVEEFLKTYGK